MTKRNTARTARPAAATNTSALPAAYEKVAATILAALEKGTAPWRRNWTTQGGGLPYNAVSKKPYRGVNIFTLLCAGFTDPRWATFKQIKDLGGSVNKGAKGSVIVWWGMLESKTEKNPDGTPKKFPILRSAVVFNFAQTTLAAAPLEAAEAIAGAGTAAERGLALVRAYCADGGPTIETGGRACYSPARDVITMPPARDFTSADAYVATLFHEAAHSTGAATRHNRPGVVDPIVFGSHTYGVEELIAELASAFLASDVGLDTSVVDDAAAYCAGWAAKIREEPRTIMQAAGAAGRAAELVRAASEAAADDADDAEFEADGDEAQAA
jgi:antirestriction protein ArdC